MTGLRKGRGMLLLAVVLLVAMAGSLLLGRFPLSVSELTGFAIQELTGHGSSSMDPARRQVVSRLLWEVRLPRILVAVSVGLGLSVSGAAYQAMFMNPLVSPGLLGTLAGSSCGAALGLLLGWSWTAVQAAAFCGGVLAVLAAMTLARVAGGGGPVVLVLAGMISQAFFTALVSLTKYVADPYNQLPSIVFWLMGSMAQAARRDLWPCLGIVLGAGLLAMLGKQLDALSMGEAEAASLGVEVRRLRVAVIVLATLVSALTVSVAGLIGWVGLLVPHLARLLLGPGNRLLLPGAALLGGLYLLLMDNLARMAFGIEVPIGILTALCGIPCFAALLWRVRGAWA